MSAVDETIPKRSHSIRCPSSWLVEVPRRTDSRAIERARGPFVSRLAAKARTFAWSSAGS
jgi:hypothetical protein